MFISVSSMIHVRVYIVVLRDENCNTRLYLYLIAILSVSHHIALVYCSFSRGKLQD